MKNETILRDYDPITIDFNDNELLILHDGSWLTIYKDDIIKLRDFLNQLELNDIK